MSRSEILRGGESHYPMTCDGDSAGLRRGLRASLYEAGGRRKGLTRWAKCGNLPNGCLITDAGARVGSGSDQGVGPALLEEGAHQLRSSGCEEVGQGREASRRLPFGDRDGGSLPNPCGHLLLIVFEGDAQRIWRGRRVKIFTSVHLHEGCRSYCHRHLVH